jgi:DNA-directed RNA polymerase specialized sigma subunit
MTEITERHLKIPYAVAARFATIGTYNFDEYVSVGNLALAKAAAVFDPSRVHASVCDFGAFAYQRVVWAVMGATGRDDCSDGRTERRWRDTLSLDLPDPKKKCSLGMLVEARPEPEPAFEWRRPWARPCLA